MTLKASNTGPIATRRVAFQFTTNHQYRPEDVRRIINTAGVGAANTLIGVNLTYSGGDKAAQAVLDAGAMLHLYHRGPGENNVTSKWTKSWFGDLCKMLQNNPRATSFEIDCLHGKQNIETILKVQQFQREHNLNQQVMLKNVDAATFKALMTHPQINQAMISPFNIMERNRNGKGGGYDDAYADAAKAYGSSIGHVQVATYDTNMYQTDAPIYANMRLPVSTPAVAMQQRPEDPKIQKAEPQSVAGWSVAKPKV
jgi:hypothetical protein